LPEKITANKTIAKMPIPADIKSFLPKITVVYW